MQRNKQVAMGRKKFNMDPKKVLWGGLGGEWGSRLLVRLHGGGLCQPVWSVLGSVTLQLGCRAARWGRGRASTQGMD